MWIWGSGVQVPSPTPSFVRFTNALRRQPAALAGLGVGRIQVPTTDFRPTASWPLLRLRAKLLARLRAFFDERGFLEVETPLLSTDTVVDRYIDPLAMHVGERQLFLQTSPEFAMKRMLASGGTECPAAIYQVCKAFRGGEQGRLHNLEFSMVEWYRMGDGYAEGMKLLSDLADALLALGPAERISYREAFLRHAGFDPHTTPTEAMTGVCRARGISIPNSLALSDRDGWLNLLLADCVEPNLGQARPTILYDYPASQAALARVRNDDPPVAERFELYVRGVELANGFHELLDPAVLRARNAENNRLREAEGKSRLPEESRLLAAMEHGIPPCTGVALGFDRLVMIAAGATSLAEVMAFGREP